MYSIVVMVHRNNKDSILGVLVGIRIDSIYEDMRQGKLYNTEEMAKDYFELRLMTMRGV